MGTDGWAVITNTLSVILSKRMLMLNATSLRTRSHAVREADNIPSFQAESTGGGGNKL